MMQLSFGEVIKTVLQVLVKSKNPIILFIVFLSLFILIYKDKIKLANKKIALTLLGGLLGITLMWQFGNTILPLLDQLINQLTITLFFPSMAYYLIMIITTNIIAILTLKKQPKLYIKRLNLIVASLIDISLLVILYQITKQNINVYSQISLYKNVEISALIEFSMIIFTFWIISLGVIVCINKLTTEEIEEEQTEKPVLEPIKNIQEVYRQPVLPVEDSPIDYNAYINTYPNRLFDNNESIVTIAQSQMKEQVMEEVKEKEFLTLDDYRNLLSLLKGMRGDISSEKVKEFQATEDMKLQEILFNSLYLDKQF